MKASSVTAATSGSSSGSASAPAAWTSDETSVTIAVGSFERSEDRSISRRSARSRPARTRPPAAGPAPSGSPTGWGSAFVVLAASSPRHRTTEGCSCSPWEGWLPSSRATPRSRRRSRGRVGSFPRAADGRRGGRGLAGIAHPALDPADTMAACQRASSRPTPSSRPSPSGRCGSAWSSRLPTTGPSSPTSASPTTPRTTSSTSSSSCPTSASSSARSRAARSPSTGRGVAHLVQGGHPRHPPRRAGARRQARLWAYVRSRPPLEALEPQPRAVRAHGDHSLHRPPRRLLDARLPPHDDPRPRRPGRPRRPAVRHRRPAGVGLPRAQPRRLRPDRRDPRGPQPAAAPAARRRRGARVPRRPPHPRAGHHPRA